MSESQDVPTGEPAIDQYSKVVTNIGEIEELTDLIRLNGRGADGTVSSLIEDTIVRFGDNDVTVKAFDPMASVWVHLRGPFTNVRRSGALVIGDIGNFRSYLSRFGEHTIVEITEQDGQYVISFNDEDRKQGGYPSTDETHIQSAEQVEDLPYRFTEDMDYPGVPEAGREMETWFTCDAKDIQDILEDGDTTEVRKYPITAEDGHVQVRVGDEDGWIDTDFTADKGNGVASSVFSYGMDNVWSNLRGQIDVYLEDEGPMWVHVDNDEVPYVIDYMIAEDETT